MFHHILLAWDGSPSAERAVDVVIDLARRYDADVTAASVAYAPAHAETTADRRESVDGARRHLEESFARIHDRAERAGVMLDQHILESDDPASALLAYAHDHAFDLVVVGHHARGRGGRVLRRALRSAHGEPARSCPRHRQRSRGLGSRMSGRTTIDDLLGRSSRATRPSIRCRRTRGDARRAVLVDIRSQDQRRADGVVPGAHWFPRNVLEWRVDPASPNSHPAVSDPEALIVLMCAQGSRPALPPRRCTTWASPVRPTSSTGSRAGGRPGLRSSRSTSCGTRGRVRRSQARRTHAPRDSVHDGPEGANSGRLTGGRLCRTRPSHASAPASLKPTSGLAPGVQASPSAPRARTTRGVRRDCTRPDPTSSSRRWREGARTPETASRSIPRGSRY